jgi:hypothetical protein
MIKILSIKFWNDMTVNFIPVKCWLTILLLVSACFSKAEAEPQSNPPVKGSLTNQTQNIALSPEQPMFSLAGFGSLGLLHSSQKTGDYVLESYLPSGAGRSNEWDTRNYSKLAAQLNASFSPQISGQLQVITAFESDGTYQPEIEWLNLKYSFSQDAYVRVGRVGWPTFFDSGNHDVGYSYPWAHPPSELYYLLPIQSGNGIDAMYRYGIGDARNTIKAVAGENTINGQTVTLASKNMLGIFDTVEYGDTTIHAGYQTRNTSIQNNLTGRLDSVTEFNNLSFGIIYDTGNWFLMSEWIQSRTSYKANAMYASVGYRIRKFTPYLIHGQNTPGSFTMGSMPSAFQMQLANRSQRSDSIGLRWDFKKNFDLKLQYDQVTLSDHSNGFLENLAPNQTLYGSTFYLFSSVVDFLF